MIATRSTELLCFGSMSGIVTAESHAVSETLELRCALTCFCEQLQTRTALGRSTFEL